MGIKTKLRNESSEQKQPIVFSVTHPEMDITENLVPMDKGTRETGVK